MAEATEVTLQEQLECIERQISFHKMVLACFEDESVETAAEMRRELDCLKAIRETVFITYGLEKIAEEYEKEAINVEEKFHLETAN